MPVTVERGRPRARKYPLADDNGSGVEMLTIDEAEALLDKENDDLPAPKGPKKSKMVPSLRVKSEDVVTITPPDFGAAAIPIIGTAPLMQAKFSSKATAMIKEKHEAGSTARSKRVREKRNFDAEAHAAIHFAKEGWVGVPAAAFRAAMISACRLVGFHMTLAKLSLFVDADGIDNEDGQPLVKLVAGDPEISIMHVRNSSGVVDLRARPLWREWGGVLRVRWDRYQFTNGDVYNLVHRAGQQVGIGEGRPDSKMSIGLGYGLFTLADLAKRA